MKHSQRGLSTQFAIIIVAVILVSAGTLAIIQGRNNATNTTSNANTEVIVDTSENTNIESDTNTTTSVNVNAVANTNTKTNTNASNSNTNSSGTTILSVSDAIAGAARYDKTKLCLTGLYQESFEFTAMSEKESTAPYVWIDFSIPQSSLECTTSSVGQKTCKGVVTACGTFQYAAPNEIGLGHVNAYRYQLESSSTTNEEVKTNLNAN